MNDPVRTRERLGSEWMLVPLAIASGILVAFGLKLLRQPAARFLLPGPIAYDVAQAVTPQLREQAPTADTSVNPTARAKERKWQLRTTGNTSKTD